MILSYVLHVHYLETCYEVTVRGTGVYRVVKYIGDSQTPMETSFWDLSPEVQNLIVNQINNRFIDDEE